jgi:hypothetical protein
LALKPPQLASSLRVSSKAAVSASGYDNLVPVLAALADKEEILDLTITNTMYYGFWSLYHHVPSFAAKLGEFSNLRSLRYEFKHGLKNW